MNSRVLSSTASCDVSSSTCRALAPGGSRHARTAHPPSNAPDDDAAPSEQPLEDLAHDPLDGNAAPGELLGGGGAVGGWGTVVAGVGSGAVALAARPDADAPSELLVPLLEWPDLLGLVLARLDPTDYALLSRVGKPWLAAMVSRGLPLAGKGDAAPLKRKQFVVSVELLAWAKANGCRWVKSMCNSIARGGHLAVLQWAREHGCPWDHGTCEHAAVGGHLEVLQWAREHHCPWGERTCALAAEGGHLAVLRWAREHGCPWGERTCQHAAMNGHLEVLQWAREHHCPWGTGTCTFAARGGHLQILQWARQHHCPWDEDTCALAARGGHLQILQWAREHHCPWNRLTCDYAAGAWAGKGGHLAVLQWAVANGCPWSAHR